ncbi:hypothetical protein QBC43DRAFT_32083 [Cladorrhinum sp. PSN259]|nr:hypothetical protein QBC43DRAFT_32083 [Cladorrhinum sp. PSN259]
MLDEQHTNSSLSDYSFSAQPNMLSPGAPGFFSFSHTGPADLSGSAWDTTVEGPQNFPEFTETGDYYTGETEDFVLPFGQMTPKPDHSDVMDDFSARWNSDNKALKAEPMRRVTSRSSTGSHKIRSNKASSVSAKKTRPRVQSMLSQTSAQMSKLDMSGNVPVYQDGRVMDVQQYLELDTLSVGAPGYYHNMMNFPDGLPYAGDMGAMAQHVNPQIFDTGLISHSPPQSWSSLSPVDSPLSSPGVQDGSDDVWSAPHSASSPGESHHSNSPPLPGQSPSMMRNASQFVTSEDLQANLMPAIGEDAFALPPAFGSRRLSGEGESARDHYLYKNAYPHADGLFHCPWEGQPSCNHKAEKLKCNYDKFVDSHLKPYRCKVEGCQNARFSSTACLLRHEREAHAMHGHGEKPYLCTYEGCERSVSGHGFPRQWNLRDHMRRVHNDNGTAAQPASPPASGAAATSTRGRKRKTEGQDKPSGQEKTSSRKSAKAAAEASKPVEPLVNLEVEQWWEHQRALQSLVSGYGGQPGDHHAIQYIKDAQDRLNAMGKISQDLVFTSKPEAPVQSSYRRSWRN